MKRKKINVLGIPFEVKFVSKASSEDSKEELFGETDGGLRIIKIFLQTNKNVEMQQYTLLHEYCHAVLHVTGQTEMLSDEQEEAIVVAMEHGLAFLAPSLWDNLYDD